jgi:alkanesulfonate monooxygenase SsuD/methylene tetrahydromethanopterin reductase-like flavin-dependent oxidoreductase (luciferase family)
MTTKRLGFFTRILDDAPASTRYQNAIEQIQTAERLGFDSAWVAQHHFHREEGGLPSPLVFLAFAAAVTDRIRLGTGIITLPLENAIRVAEDAAVLDQLSGGRLEVGVGSGGTPSSFTGFGLESADRSRISADHLAVILSAWAGNPIGHPDNTLYPAGTGPRRPRLAGHLLGRGRTPRGTRRRRPDAVAYPTATVAQPRCFAQRHPESHHRRVPRRAAQYVGAADCGFAHPVCL